MIDLESLNPPQREAVLHGDGPLLVLAGAGSGKTRVLTYRIADLVQSRGVDPASILAVTFTNPAAREMRERISHLVGSEHDRLTAGTFHSTCARWLRSYAPRLGLPSGFAIYDDSDQLSVCTRALSDCDIDEELLAPRALRTHLDRARNDLRDPTRAPATAEPERAAAISQAAERYEFLLEKAGALDFGGLIAAMVRLLRDDADLRERFRARYRHILVDEYQDVNHAQYLLVDHIAGRNGNLCVVGDDDQSIYGFRGASVRAILEFERDHANAHVVRLEENYRSKGNILAAANAVIERNLGRHGKKLWTRNDPGEKVTVAGFPDDRSEARWVAGELLREIGRGRPPAGLAVFYRTNAQSRAIEEELVRLGVRYVVVGGIRFYDRKEVKDVLAYLRVLLNPADDVSLMRIVNVPTRGIGATTVATLVETAGRSGRSISALLDELVANPGAVVLATGARARVLAFRDLLHRIRATLATSTLGEIVECVVSESGLGSRLQAEATQEAQTRAENLDELIAAARELDASLGAPDGVTALATFLERAALVTSLDEADGVGTSVSLMTVHNSKGLEFPVVHLVGLEEGIFPHSRALDDGSVEEERRLCYVGMTRARERLVLSCARTRAMFGALKPYPPSRFLTEIPDEFVSRHGADPAARARRAGHGELANTLDRFLSPARTAAVPAPDAKLANTDVRVDYSMSQEPVSAGSLRVGTPVLHPRFGRGVIRRREGDGESTKLMVQFERFGLKTLLARLAPLVIEGRST